MQAADAPAPAGGALPGGRALPSAAEGALVLTQQDSGAEAGYEPTITLYPDGTFALFASFYDGSVTISGTYAQEGGRLRPHPHGQHGPGHGWQRRGGDYFDALWRRLCLFRRPAGGHL